MARKFKHTEQRRLAVSVLDLIEWELEPTEQEKQIKAMVGNLTVRRAMPRAPKVIYTVEVMQLRDAAMEGLKNQIIAHTSGLSEGSNGGSVKGSFKRLQEHRRINYNQPAAY